MALANQLIDDEYAAITGCLANCHAPLSRLTVPITNTQHPRVRNLYQSL